MKNITLILMTAVGLTTAADARSPINLDILRRDGYGVVPIKHPRPNELIVRATVNDRAVDLALDTGWGAHGNGIALDQTLARALKLNTTPLQSPERTWTGAKLRVEQAVANFVEVGNARIMGVPLYFSGLGGLSSASGIISVGFLRATSAIIDLPNFRLYVRPAGVGRRAVIGPALKEIGMAEVPLIGNGSHFFVRAEINGVSGVMAIDTGANFTMVEKEFALHAKARSRGWNLRPVDASGKMGQADVGDINSFRIGGVPAYAPNLTFGRATFGSKDMIGLIGMDVLGQNWSIIDCGGQKLYFSSRVR
jgi:predicted aspartyl protease